MKKLAIRSLLGLAALLLSLGASLPVRAQLNDTEQRIVAAVKARSEAALDLLERAARINSGTLNASGVRAVGEVFRAELDGLGFATRWVELPPSMKRAGHLMAERTGQSGARLLLLGHLDTVFEPNSAVTTWQRQGDRVRGQGVSDMKGGDVVLVEALRALHSVGVLDGARIAVMLTGDEERPGSPVQESRAPLVALARNADYALSFEPSLPVRGEASVSIARRSSGGWVLRVRARPGHSAGVFSPGSGYGAVYEGVRILNSFRERLIEPNLTFNVGLIGGGTQVAVDEESATLQAFGKGNVIARDFEARGDLRYLTPEQGERARQRMREIVGSDNLPHATASIRFSEGYPPMPPSAKAEQLAAMYSKASEDAGLGRVHLTAPNRTGAGDIQFVAPYTTGLDGLGVAGRGAHTDAEDLEIASIERGAIRAALLIYRLTRP